MDLGIAGRTAIVTGSGRGIGRQIALTLAEDGVKVAVNDYFENRARNTADEIVARGGVAMPVRADITQPDDVQAMVKAVVGEWGSVGILVNNAGIAPRPTEEEDPEAARALAQRLAEGRRSATEGGTGYFHETTRESWQSQINLIILGTMTCTHAVLPHMIDALWGRVISIISDAGRVGEPRLVAYSMAKSGVVGFTKAVAKEMGRYAITVNCVAPGATDTEATVRPGMTPEQNQARIDNLKRSYPMARGLNRLGQPSDIANAVAFLASARAEWITGQTLSVNGGYSMH